MQDICAFLGGRADKDFLGTGNLGLVVQQRAARLLFVQRWWEGGVCDWVCGAVRSWAPDRIELQEPIPPAGARLSHPSTARWVFAARSDVIGLVLEWQNPNPQPLVINAAFTGRLPGTVRVGQAAEAGYLYALTPYSTQVPQPVHVVLAASLPPAALAWDGDGYEVSFQITAAPHSTARFTLFVAIGLDFEIIEAALNRWHKTNDVLAAVRQDWNAWFDSAIPRFTCSDPYVEKLYYYRWWSLYTKMIFARVGHLLYPAPREGTVAFEALVSYSGACVSVDELRWMRRPDWAFSTTRAFFAPQNLNDGYLANHIWDWGIDGDESNIDTHGRSVPYQNYAVAAFYGALLVHPQEGVQVLREIWPQLHSNLESYPRLFDHDGDNLYETYPWSNSAGQEWAARFFYFDPIPEIFRYERGRTYTPDGSRAGEDMTLLEKIRASVVASPNLEWPDSADALYRLYNATLDHRLATVDQTTYAYQNFLAAARLARWMNDAPAQQRYSRMADDTRTQIDAVLWNAEDAFFYDVQLLTHQPARVKSVTGFFVFWARIARTAHLPMLEHLFRPTTFWTAYPLPSLPLDYETYPQLQAAGWTYWNYCTWPRTTCHVVDGLLWAAKTLDPTLSEKAAHLFARYTCMHFPKNDLSHPNIAERYDPHTAEPYGENLDYNHSSWIDLLVQHAAGITPQDSDTLLVDPLDMGWEAFTMTNIRYRDHDIDVEFSRGAGLLVCVDGQVRAQAAALQRLSIPL